MFFRRSNDRDEPIDPDQAAAVTSGTNAFERFVPQRRFQPTVALSRDGTTVAYSANDGGQYNLRLTSLDGHESRQLTSFPDQSVRDVAWSPDGSSLAFAADRDGDEQHQIYIIDAVGGDARRITKAGDRQFELATSPFSSSGTTLVYAGNDRDESVQDLIIHDLATDTLRRIDSVPGELISPFGLSPDGRWLLVAIARSNNDVDCALLDLTVDGAGLQVLTSHDGDALYVPAGWLADSSGFYVMTDELGEFRSLAICTSEGGLTPLETPDWDVVQVRSTEDGTTLVWVVNESGTSVPHVRVAHPGSRAPSDAATIPLSPGVLGPFDVTPDGKTLVGLFGTGTRPQELVTIDVATGDVDHLTDSRPPALTEISPVAPQPVEFDTHDGRRIPAWLYRPAGGGNHPVVLSIHGGPEAQELPVYAYSGLYQYLLSKGIGVLAPNVRGSTGYGVSYQKLIHRDWGGNELGDFECSVKFLSSLDWVDARRIAVFGGSFGGFAALSCMSRLPELFAAGVSIVGPSNLVTFVKAVPPTWRPLMAKWVGDPVEDHDLLIERSPITYVDRITAPLMVVQGAKDPRVVKSESDQIVEALRSRGVDVRYDVYDDEGHGFTKRINEIKALGDVAEFLIERLAPRG